jgi:hypothetical protein
MCQDLNNYERLHCWDPIQSDQEIHPMRLMTGGDVDANAKRKSFDRTAAA